MSTGPLIRGYGAATTGDLHGSPFDEGNPHPCLAFGTEAGQVRYGMAVAGWPMILALPLEPACPLAACPRHPSVVVTHVAGVTGPD